MIAIITYDTPHRKTQDLIYKLILNGHSDLHLIVIPWVERKNFVPLYKHRPTAAVNISNDILADRINIRISRLELDELNSYFSKNKFQHILIAGAGILPEELSKNHKIINSHPGYLPNLKGLDALKWAIYNNQPIGVTTHYISDKADEGLLIERNLVPVYFEDTFHNLTYRVYETEIDMLANAIHIIDTGKANLESLANDNFSANRRMSHHLEKIMIEKFEELRNQSKSFTIS